MAAAAPILSARGVVKTYRTGTHEVHALRGVDLDVHPGELVMVMGPSGNGKTTMLNCLSGLDDIDGGAVTIDGADLFAMSDRDRTRHRAQRMGFVFQSFNLIPVLSAAENVELPLLVTGATPKAARERAMEMLARVGLADRASHRPGELSGGEQQRVTVARALVAEPAIVWADEPTGALDSRTAGEIVDLLHEVHAAGQTLVVVTHDAALGRSGERLVQVRDGLIVHDGHPDDAVEAGTPAPDHAVPPTPGPVASTRTPGHTPPPTPPPPQPAVVPPIPVSLPLPAHVVISLIPAAPPAAPHPPTTPAAPAPPPATAPGAAPPPATSPPARQPVPPEPTMRVVPSPTAPPAAAPTAAAPPQPGSPPHAPLESAPDAAVPHEPAPEPSPAAASPLSPPHVPTPPPPPSLPERSPYTPPGMPPPPPTARAWPAPGSDDHGAAPS